MDKRFNIFLFFVAMGWVVSCISPVLAVEKNAGAGISKIVVNEYSQVQGEQIRLGQIATIEAIPFVREVLENISLGRSPKPGKIKTLAGNRIASRIRSGRDLPGEIRVIAPDKIYVKLDHQEISEQEIRGQIEQWLDEYYKDREYEIKTLRIQTPDLYPAGQLELNLPAPLNVDKRGNLNLPITVSVNNRKVDTLRIRGELALYEMVPCAIDYLEKGRAISSGDVIPVKKDVFGLHTAVVRDMESFEACRLKTDVKKGSPVRDTWLEMLPLIRKGDVVSLVARAESLKIETSGIAMEDGFQGRPVKVENMTSGKLVRGIAKAPAIVEVVY